MISYIDEYNDNVEKQCMIKNKKHKEKQRNGLLNPNLKFSSSLNAFIPPDDDSPKIKKTDFMNIVKNNYESLGKEPPSDVEIEDVYDKVASMLNNQQIDMNQFNGFFSEILEADTINDAYNNFISNLNQYQPEPEPEAPVFQNFYPPVGQEELYGFAGGGLPIEAEFARLETERRKDESQKGRPTEAFFTGERGRPHAFELPHAPASIGQFQRPPVSQEPTSFQSNRFSALPIEGETIEASYLY